MTLMQLVDICSFIGKSRRTSAYSVLAGLNRGKAAVEFEHPDEAEKAVKHMDGGQLDGSFLAVQVSCVQYRMNFN